MTTTALMAKIKKLRKRYQDWKERHPSQESENMINEFLLLKEKLAEKGIKLPKQDTLLDLDTEAFEKRLKIISFRPEPGKVFKFVDGRYAPVNPSGETMGSPISLSDFEPHFRDFLAASPVIWAVGGIVEHDSTVNDCDILCSLPSEEELQRIVNFRLFRMLPENVADRVSFLHEKKGAIGPFTDALPLFRLKLERIPDAEIVKMSESDMSFAEITLRAKGAAKQEKEANISMREDKVVLGQYFKAMKPFKISPPLEQQSVDVFLKAIEDEGLSPGWWSSKKFDGFRTTFHIRKGKLINAFSDDGIDNLKKFPQAADEAKNLWPDQDLVLDAEVEWIDYKKRQHFPREVAASYLRKKDVFDDSSLCISVFDCVYLDKDIHNEPFSERWKKFKELNFPQNTNACPNKDYRWNLIPHYLGKTIEEIREHTKKVSKAFGSEGNVAKKADSIHTLTGKRIGWVKWHRTSLLYGLVTGVFETKTEGIFNIEWSVDSDSYPIAKKDTREVHGKKFLLGGKTFATTLEPKIGKDIIQIELETLNFIHDKRSGTYDISAWAPRFLRIATDRKTPDSVSDAVKRAIKNRVYQEKIINPDGSVEYLPGASAEEFPSKSESMDQHTEIFQEPKHSMAVIGSKAATPEMLEATAYQTKKALAGGWGIVTGGAAGVDAEAIKTSLKTLPKLSGGKMEFRVKNVADFLDSKGQVFTSRPYNLPDAKVIVEGLGPCQRTRVGKATPELYAQYLDRSGFKSVKEWGGAKFSPGKEHYIYRVEQLPKNKMLRVYLPKTIKDQPAAVQKLLLEAKTRGFDIVENAGVDRAKTVFKGKPTYGQAAFARNKTIIDKSDAVVAVQRGTSKGTSHGIADALERGQTVKRIDEKLNTTLMKKEKGKVTIKSLGKLGKGVRVLGKLSKALKVLPAVGFLTDIFDAASLWQELKTLDEAIKTGRATDTQKEIWRTLQEQRQAALTQQEWKDIQTILAQPAMPPGLKVASEDILDPDKSEIKTIPDPEIADVCTTTDQDPESVTDIENMQEGPPKLLKLPGIYLVEPHGRFIALGEKVSIIKSRPFPNMTGKDLFLISDNLCWAIVNLKPAEKITQDQFRRRKESHKISMEEAEEWWDLAGQPEKELYDFRFKVKRIFAPPRPVKIPRGIQTFLKPESISFEKI